jgi:hypothetical protein
VKRFAGLAGKFALLEKRCAGLAGKFALPEKTGKLPATQFTSADNQ